MTNSIKQIAFIACLFALSVPEIYGLAKDESTFSNVTQIDSLIETKNMNNEMARLDLLTLYQNALEQKHPDSIKVVKNLAILNAELEWPKEAALFAEKYIKETLDLSILNNSSFQDLRESQEISKLNKKYMPKVGFMSIFFVFTSFIGLFIAIVINFKTTENRTGNFLISLFVFLHSLFIINSVLYITNYMYKVPQTLFITVSFSYLYGPLLYFYFKSITKAYVFKVVDLLHLIPTLAIVVYAIPVYALSTEEKLSFMINNSYDFPGFLVIFIVLTKFLSLAIYTYAIHKIYLKNKQEATNGYFSLTIKWQHVLRNISIAYVVTYLLYGYAGLFMPYVTAARLPQILIMALSVLSIAFTAYIKPELFGSMPAGLNHFFKDKKYRNSGLTQNLSNELKEDLIQLFNEKKIYKENNISLETLSDKLNTTRHNTSQIINEHFDMNFFELINKFRIQEATRMLKDDTHGSLNIIDVAYEVGYNNKVTFNKAFKKEMSITPSEYIQTYTRNTSR